MVKINDNGHHQTHTGLLDIDEIFKDLQSNPKAMSKPKSISELETESESGSEYSSISFNIENSNIDSDQCEKLSKMFTTFNIDSFYMSKCPIDARCIKNLFDIKHDNNSIRCISLRNNNINDYMLKTLVPLMSNFKVLYTIDLSSNMLTNDSDELLMSMFSKITTLKYIFIHNKNERRLIKRNGDDGKISIQTCDKLIWD